MLHTSTGIIRELEIREVIIQLKTKKQPSKKEKEMSATDKKQKKSVSHNAYGDKVPICANTGCALRKKAKCYGFEGCPGFQSR
jgi:hypothetical protein